ncbi:hypothetical protein [[Acholeplasma] multilocale]|uniref:hypothetical protein n=1 Tax=[Acholeplasma] multilocale TaxID=264638 RepID=UPI00047C272B|nr:hypothetical protein [[Acholeplasma] multilocale]
MANNDRVWVPAFSKYLDELTNEEWMEMSNSTCDSPLASCSTNLEEILEGQKQRREAAEKESTK